MNKLRDILAALAVTAMCASGPGTTAVAQIGRESEQAVDHLGKGESAFEKGQFDLAAQNFSRALRADDIEDKAVARILYRRGAAYERAGKPAQAIADLTKALYLPDLPAADRAQAYLTRGRAYEAVGLGDRARSDIAKARSGGADERTIARAAEPAPQSRAGGGTSFTTTSEAVGSGSRSTPTFSTRSNTAARPAPTFSTSSARAPAPPPSFETSSSVAEQQKRRQVAAFDTRSRAASESGEEQIPRFRTTILPEDNKANANAAGTQGEAPKESGGTVTRFFGNVWSKATGGDKEDTPAAPPAPAPQWSQSTQTARAPAPSWSSQTSTTATPTPTPAPPRAQPASPAAGSGYRIQLAALKTDAEAQATWKRLQSRHAGLLGGHQPNIVKTELGGLGTFYRVQLGPFADKEQSKQLCSQFKAGGLDCFLLAP